MITVIADDLTGAAEIAGICIRYGLDVAFGIDTIPEKKATVSIIATDSRSKTEDEAYQIHLQLAHLVITNPENQILFKKCDSALRGHVLTELKALSVASQKSQILLQPSNPAAQRCIRNGSYWIEGHLIETTGFAHDPDFPATSSAVEKLIFRNATINEISLVCGTSNTSNWKGIYIPDCNSIDDLKKCAELFHSEIILSGSSGFFEQILIQQGLANQKKAAIAFSTPTTYLLLSGSTHPESIRFAKKLENSNCPLIVLPDSLVTKETNATELTEWIQKLGQVFDKKQKVILRTSNTIIQFENSSKILKNRVSHILQELLKLTKINELYIEGGATAYDVLQKLQWLNFTPIAELAPGVIRMQLVNDKTKFITIKPGSYSWPEGLLQ
jgi:uncharacterized protein YgbK (DUF1537 family)